jgi:hypothetical protein
MNHAQKHLMKTDEPCSQTFDEDWWTIQIESSTEWTLNQLYEFKVFKSLNTPRPKTKDEYYWYFVSCINIKEDEDTYAFNKKFNTVQNSSRRLEEGGDVDSLHWMFVGWHLCASL